VYGHSLPGLDWSSRACRRRCALMCSRAWGYWHRRQSFGNPSVMSRQLEASHRGLSCIAIAARWSHCDAVLLVLPNDRYISNAQMHTLWDTRSETRTHIRRQGLEAAGPFCWSA